jgi:hypothetical protein
MLRRGALPGFPLPKAFKPQEQILGRLLVRARPWDNARAIPAYAFFVQRASATTPAAIGIFSHQIVANAVLAARCSDPARALANTAAALLPRGAGSAGRAAICQSAICGSTTVERVRHRIDTSSKTRHKRDLAACGALSAAAYLVAPASERSGVDG